MIARALCVAAMAAGLAIGSISGCTEGSSDDSEQSTAPTEPSPPSLSSEEIRSAIDAAEQYFNAGDNANARVILMRLVRDAPRELTAREFLGQVHAAEAAQHDAAGRAVAARQSRQSAWEQYREAVSLAPQQAGLHHSAALMALAADEREAAIELLQEAVRLDPLQTQYPLYLAQLLIQDGRLDDAEALTSDAIQIDPDEPHLHATLAAIELERGKHEVALHHVRESRTIAPDETAFRVLEAKIFRRWERPRDALELLTPLPADEKAREYVTWEIAANYEALGEQVMVAQAWERCFRADPLHQNAWLWAVHVGDALVAADRPTEAMLWLEHAQRMNPDATEIQILAEAIQDSIGRDR